MTEPRVAIVTGAARGIGAATTLRLAAGGWTVIAVDRGSDDPRLPYALGTSQQLEQAVARANAASAATAATAGATRPDTTRPDTTHPDQTRPDTTRPDTTRPDTTRPDTTRPDTTHPDQTRPNATRPDTTRPDVTHPNQTRPDATRPYTTHPNATRPTATRPDAVTAAIADATDLQAMQAIVDTTVEHHGGLDAFIAAAGVIAGGVPQWELDLAQEQAVLDVCLGAVLTASRVAIPALLKRPQPRRGRFLAVSSTAALRGLPMLAAYCAAKAGVAGLMKALGAELRGTGITANAVAPGSTRTPILHESARLYGLEDAEAFAAQQPLERLIEPDEVAALLVWLAGPDADAMTGAIIPVDGGLSI